MQEIIQAEGLTKSYNGKPVVDGMSLSVGRGVIFGLLGANGAGKSTAIECILGTKKADRGKATILGMDPLADRKKLFQQVGVQFQEPQYQDNLKVWELCQVTESLYDNPSDPNVLLEQFGLAGKKKSFIKDLSGGQQQRLFIVLALIPMPKVVFLDELTTGLDPKARREVWGILSALKEKGLTIFLTSHFMEEIEMLCDRICILKKGKTVFYGTIAEAIEASPYKKLEDAYLWYTGEEGKENENI